MEGVMSLIEKHSVVAETTLNQYRSQFNVLFKRASDYFGLNIENELGFGLLLDRIKFDPENIINVIVKNWTGGTQKTYMNIVIVYLRSLIQEEYRDTSKRTDEAVRILSSLDKYREVWVKKQKEYEAETALGQMTEKQKASFLTWEKFDEYIAKAMEKWGQYSTQVLTLMLYRFQPLRADYAILQYKTDPDSDGNYWTGSELVINDYKTAKTYGTIRGVSPMIGGYLNNYIKEQEVKDGEYFFPERGLGHSPISRNLLGKRVLSYFRALGNENPPNLQQLRHIYLMNKYGTIKKEMDNDAFLMGHSKDTQNKYILDFD